MGSLKSAARLDSRRQLRICKKYQPGQTKLSRPHGGGRWCPDVTRTRNLPNHLRMWQIGSRGLEVTEVSGMLGMNWSPGANHQIAHKRPTLKGNGGGRMCKATSTS